MKAFELFGYTSAMEVYHLWLVFESEDSPLFHYVSAMCLNADRYRVCSCRQVDVETMDDFAAFIKECYEADTHSTDPLLFVRLSGIEVVHYGMRAAFFDPAAWLAFADEYLPTPPNGHTVH